MQLTTGSGINSMTFMYVTVDVLWMGSRKCSFYSEMYAKRTRQQNRLS